MSQQRETELLRELAELPALSRAEADYAATGCLAGFLVERERIVEAAGILLAKGYFLESISGLDADEGLMVVYHFDRFDRCERLALRVLAPHQDKRVPSIAAVFHGADWHERETCDFFGVVFDGHPNLKPLLLPDDLGINPLVKEQGRRSLYHLLPLRQMVDYKP